MFYSFNFLNFSSSFLYTNTNSIVVKSWVSLDDFNSDENYSLLDLSVYPVIASILRSGFLVNFFRFNVSTDAFVTSSANEWSLKYINLRNSFLTKLDSETEFSTLLEQYLYLQRKYHSSESNNISTTSTRTAGSTKGYFGATKAHPFHLVDVSPWPLMTSLGIFFLLFGIVLFFHFYSVWAYFVVLGTILLLYALFSWWNDVLNEGLYLGHHTSVVRKGFRIGMILFILSEAMFFLGFFWAFFTSSWCPTPFIGCVWPPMSILALDPLGVPALNTFILLLSGLTVTVSHEYLVTSNVNSDIAFSRSRIYLLITVILGLLFTSFQLLEYIEAPFNISDSIYGSIFFVTTGFHGLHVIIGTLFLAYHLVRLQVRHITNDDSVGLELAIWY